MYTILIYLLTQTEAVWDDFWRKQDFRECPHTRLDKKKRGRDTYVSNRIHHNLGQRVREENLAKLSDASPIQLANLGHPSLAMENLGFYVIQSGRMIISLFTRAQRAIFYLFVLMIGTVKNEAECLIGIHTFSDVSENSQTFSEVSNACTITSKGVIHP